MKQVDGVNWMRMNLMKIFSLVFLLLTGCTSVDQSDLVRAEYFCKNKLGVDYINVSPFRAEYAYCNNGESTGLYNITIPSENK